MNESVKPERFIQECLQNVNWIECSQLIIAIPIVFNCSLTINVQSHFSVLLKETHLMFTSVYRAHLKRKEVFNNLYLHCFKDFFVNFLAYTVLLYI